MPIQAPLRNFDYLRTLRHDALASLTPVYSIREYINLVKPGPHPESHPISAMNRQFERLEQATELFRHSFPKKDSEIRPEHLAAQMESLKTLRAELNAFSATCKHPAIDKMLGAQKMFRVNDYVGLANSILDEFQSLRNKRALKLEKVNLSDLVREVFSEDTYTDRHGHPVAAKFDIEPGITVIGNRLALLRALTNIHSDAAIHPNVPSGEPIRLQVSLKRGENDVRFRVISKGADPLDPEIAKMIGYRVFTTRTGNGQEEHGRGKMSVRAIVEALGGAFLARNINNEPALEFALPND